MKILRNAVISSTALVLGIGAIAHASGNGYGEESSGSNSYYGQPNNSTAAAIAVAHAKAGHKQVVAKELNSRYLFSAKTVTVKVGTTVFWSNKSDAEHNVTFDKNSKVNMDFKPNKSVSYTFTKAGTYTYHCEYHPYMKGTVIVKP